MHRPWVKKRRPEAGYRSSLAHNPMSLSRIVFLMYHELEVPGRKLVQSEPGYVRYILSLDRFREQMQWLKDSGFRGLSVSDALLYPAEPGVCITFDDGCETDLIAAAPVDRKSTRLNSSHANISYAVFCLKKQWTLPQYK